MWLKPGVAYRVRCAGDGPDARRLPRTQRPPARAPPQDHGGTPGGVARGIQFKGEENRAGLTVFVAPDLVPGTLAEGFALYRSQESPFERAVYMMFLVSEVHPFADGNGRIARVMMQRGVRCRGGGADRRSDRVPRQLPRGAASAVSNRAAGAAGEGPGLWAAVDRRGGLEIARGGGAGAGGVQRVSGFR